MSRSQDGDPAPGHGARLCAVEVLTEYGRTGAYLNGLLFSHLSGCSLDRRDRALVTELVQGTVRMMGALDRVLARFSTRELADIDPGVMWILRLAAYQVMYTDIPDYAACDLAADLARVREGERTVGFVNGVMRALVRGLPTFQWPRPEDPVAFLEARYSLPRWIVEMWLEELGAEAAEKVCAASAGQPPLSLRCNLLRTTRAELQSGLEAAGARVENGKLAPEALLVKGSGPVAEMEEYRRGLFSVQDQGAIAVGRLVSPEPGAGALDLCAAPGGKANHLAEMMHNEGRVLAVDLDPSRLEKVKEAAARLGNSIVRTVAMDARRVRDGVEGCFDRVLVDAPCTGLGTLARRPDARWRKRPEDVERLAALQLELVLEAARMLGPGGLLVYSTCTVSRRENQGVVEAFLARSPGFEVVPSGTGKYLELYLSPEPCDGMFAAVLRRSGAAPGASGATV